MEIFFCSGFSTLLLNSVRMQFRTVLDVNVVNVQKRRNPSKHYVSWPSVQQCLKPCVKRIPVEPSLPKPSKTAGGPRAICGPHRDFCLTLQLRNDFVLGKRDGCMGIFYNFNIWVCAIIWNSLQHKQTFTEFYQNVDF